MMESMLRWGSSILVVAAVVLCSAARAQNTHTNSFRAEKTQFDVAVPFDELTVTDQELRAYVERAAHAIAVYFGRYPLKHVNINIQAAGGDRVRFGRSSPMNGGTITMRIGRHAKAEALDEDWTLTHEMVHLAFPATRGDNHEWLGEGMATYVEPIARMQAGYLTPQYMWGQFMDDMPRGEPGPDEGGIDEARGFRRIYWGGAMFCLLADREIRKQTHNRKGLQDAFRAIMMDGGLMDGTMEYEWGIGLILETGDKATGTHVLRDLYARWKEEPVQVDLAKVWRELGVEKKGDTVVFRDDAPEAAARKAITAGCRR
jgi:hypothetical protein